MITKRAEEIRPFIVMDVLERAQELEKQGEHIIHLEVGEPDFDTPTCIREAGERALREGKTHYTHSLGLLELREAICEQYEKKYGVNIAPDQIIVTSGTSPAMLLIFGSLLEAGDEVIISDPHYACYPNFIRFVEGVSIKIPVAEEDGFQFRPEEIRRKITPRTRGIFINSPANPTGNLLSPERMAEIADLGSMVISDEIYHGLVYEGEEHTILEYTDECFVLNGFSKLYDWLAPGLCHCTETFRSTNAENAAEFFYLCQCNGSVGWSRGPEKQRGGRRSGTYGKHLRRASTIHDPTTQENGLWYYRRTNWSFLRFGQCQAV